MGIKGYVTETKGVGGRLRNSFEDFVVEEILADGAKVSVGTGLSDYELREVPDGGYCHFTLEKTGIDFFRAIGQLSRHLRVSRKRFTYSGIKDAQAVTSQLVSIKGFEPDCLGTGSGHLQTHTPFRAQGPLTLGDHRGNAFTIKITGIDLEPAKVDLRASAIASEILNIGGVPNFFGHQRFGTTRSNTHIIGKYVLNSDFESAVWAYLCMPFKGEEPDALKSRSELMETRDFKSALASFPKRLNYERMILDHLSRSPRDFLGALRRIPRSLLSLLVRAYQSYIFNLTLSRRIEFCDPFRPKAGDVLESEGNRLLVGDSISIKEATELQENGSGRIVYSIVGYASKAEGPISCDILETMGMEKVSSSFFYTRELPDISPKGSYRDVICPVYDLHIYAAREETGRTSLKLSFWLSKGSYATVVLREFMKAGISAY